MLAKLEKGQATISTLFSSKDSIEIKINELKESIPNQEIEIMNKRLYLVLVTFQIARAAIPFFKRGKFIQYN
jgi:hypothetical protein